MAKHLNLSTIVDKNRVNSDNVFLELIEADIQDNTGTIIQTLRLARNSENIVFRGQTYQAANFDLDISLDATNEPQIKLQVQDQTRALAQYIDAYDGLINNTVRMIVVNSGTSGDVAEMEEEFKITNASVSDYVVDLQLGIESAVALRFPNYRQFKDRCPWKYKGSRCKYAGPLPTCSYTRTGPNGCVAHGNEMNFGGHPGLNQLM